jgi:WD40 repeat protein
VKRALPEVKPGPNEITDGPPQAHESDADPDEPGPSLRFPSQSKASEAPADDASDDDAEDDEPEYDPTSPSLSTSPEFPVTHEATLKEHTKVVSTLALDPSGARVLSGSHDYDCKLWDFGGMTTHTRSFKTWEPAGSYYVRVFTFLLGTDLIQLPL